MSRAARRNTTATGHFRLCLLAGLAFFAATASAQTLTLRLLNGKSGKPLPNKNLTFHWGDTKDTTVVLVDGNGIAHVTVPPGTTDFILVEGGRSDGKPDHLAVEDCNANSSSSIPVAEVVAHGIAPRNTCSTRSAPAHPGEIIFWGRTPTHWSPAFP